MDVEYQAIISKVYKTSIGIGCPDNGAQFNKIDTKGACSKPWLNFHNIFTVYSIHQGLRQDLETGCPKLPIVKFLGMLFYKRDYNILRLQHKDYLLGKIRHNFFIQCRGNYIEVRKIQSYAWNQGLSQDFKNACPKQQFQNLCPSRFSYLSTSNPYTSYI